MTPSSNHDSLYLRALRGVVLCGLLIGGVLSGPAMAAVAVGNVADYDFGAWSPGIGTVSASRDFCAVSVVGGGLTVSNPNQLRPWGARVDDLDGASSAGTFRIEHVSSGSFLDLGLRLRDLRTGVDEALVPGGTTATEKTGDELGCPRGGPNGRLEVRITAAQMAAARAGTYRGQFILEINGGSNGSDTDATTFEVRIEVPDLVRISSLDDIQLGAYSGAGDMSGTDALCVYRNDPAGAYTVQADGQGPGNAFVLSQGTNELPFLVDYSDGNGWRPLDAGGAPLTAANAHSMAMDCAGGTNASVRVRIEAAALANAEPGSYAGSLTLTVAPI